MCASDGQVNTSMTVNNHPETNASSLDRDAAPARDRRIVCVEIDRLKCISADRRGIARKKHAINSPSFIHGVVCVCVCLFYPKKSSRNSYYCEWFETITREDDE